MIKRITDIAHYKLLKVSSKAFNNKIPIPLKYTRDGLNVSPPLTIRGLPPKAKSLVIIGVNPDAPRGKRLHWLAWNIPATSQLKEGKVLGRHGKNDFGGRGYSGPLAGAKVNCIVFKVYALNSVLKNIDKDVTRHKLERAMAAQIISYGELKGCSGSKLTKPQSYSTLSEAVNGLQNHGYKDDILKLIAKVNNPGKFKIVEFHRFEGCSNPSDNSIVYAIESVSGEKGIVVDSFGTNTDSRKTDLLSKIKFRRANR